MTFLFCLLLDLFNPVSGTAYRCSPAFYHCVPFRIINLCAENPLHITAFQNRFFAFPESYGKTCKISSSKCGCLNAFRTLYSYIADIRLDLKEKVIGTCSAIYTENCKITSRIFLHNLQYIIHLICKRFQCCPDNMILVYATGQTYDRTTRILIPVRSSKSCKRRHNIAPVCIRYFSCKIFRV